MSKVHAAAHAAAHAAFAPPSNDALAGGDADADPATAPAPGHVAVHLDAATAFTVGAGCVRRPLPAPPGARAWLVELAPGSQWPRVDIHDTGAAYVVLAGEVIEGQARHRAGTHVVFTPGSRHRPRSDTGARLLVWRLDADAYLGAGGDPATLHGRLHLQQG